MLLTSSMTSAAFHTIIGLVSVNFALRHYEIRRHLNIVADEDDVGTFPIEFQSDYYDDDTVVYDNYVATTVDSGWLLFIVASAISVVSVALMPLSVRLGKRWSNTDLFLCGKIDSTMTGEESDDEGSHLTLEADEPPRPRALLQKAFAWVIDLFVYRRKKQRARRLNLGYREEAISRACSREKRQSVVRIVAEASQHHDGYNGEVESSVRALPCVVEKESDDQQRRNNTLPGEIVSSGKADQQTGSFLQEQWGLFRSIIRFDHEIKRLLYLAVPFLISALIYTIADLLILGLISHYLGTDSMVAYTLVGLTTGITGGFIGGIVEAMSSLASMAYGAENYFLVGQYVQLACTLYTLCQIPLFFFWGAYIGDVLLLFGFDETAAEIASRYVWISMTMTVISGIDWTLFDFLEVTGREVYANVIGCIGTVVEVLLVWAALHFYESNLVFVGLVFLGTQVVFLLLNLCICIKCGWLEQYEHGMFRSLAFRNREALKVFLKTTLPLAFGSLLAYAEWEILTVFAAFLGPAEAATWAVLGYVWDVFESTTGALGSAGEVRCSHQLGKGDPELAKLSSYKTMFMALLVSMISTTIFFSLHNVLPAFLTTDETIQDMLVTLFPLVGLGNVMMSVGMVCWSLVGAQLRYQLATKIATATSLGITLPLAATFTIALNYDLKGLTFSVVVGYLMTAMILTTILLISDWEKLSNRIREKVAVEDDESSSSSFSRMSRPEEEVDSQDKPDGNKQIDPATESNSEKIEKDVSIFDAIHL